MTEFADRNPPFALKNENVVCFLTNCNEVERMMLQPEARARCWMCIQCHTERLHGSRELDQ